MIARQRVGFRDDGKDRVASKYRVGIVEHRLVNPTTVDPGAVAAGKITNDPSAALLFQYEVLSRDAWIHDREVTRATASDNEATFLPKQKRAALIRSIDNLEFPHGSDVSS